jgi:hypothetical protein
MWRLLLAGIAGAVVAVVVFVVVVALTDVQMTTGVEVDATGTATPRAGLRASPPPPCGKRPSLSYTFSEPQVATGALMIPVSVSLGNGTPCVLDTKARFEMQTPLKRSGINGNPLRWHLNGVLTPDSGPSSIFAWRNWCGPEGRFNCKLVVRGSGNASVRDNYGTPPCGAPGSGAPSTLDRFSIPN